MVHARQTQSRDSAKTPILRTLMLALVNPEDEKLHGLTTEIVKTSQEVGVLGFAKTC